MATKLPSIPSSDSVLILQPLAQGYIAAPRAVASALLYRYCGINTGFGVLNVSNTRDALRQLTSPMHTIQVVLAEWLQVYAYLESLNRGDDTQSVLSMTDVKKLPAPFEPIHSASDMLRRMPSGRHIPSLSALLNFLADWIGTIMPSYTSLDCGNVNAAVQPFIGNLTKVRVLHPREDKSLADLYKKATIVTDSLFIKYINSILQREETLHGTFIVQGFGGVETQAILLKKLYSKSKYCIPLPTDMDTETLHHTIEIPKEFMFGKSDDDFVNVAQGKAVLIVYARATRSWHPVFACSTEDAVLQKAVIAAMADTLVDAVTIAEPGSAELRELINKAKVLNFAMSSDAIERALRDAFQSKFGATSIAPSSSLSAPLYFAPETFDALAYAIGSLKGPVWWSILLTREDLLSIFLSTSDESRTALRTLWNDFHKSNKSSLTNDEEAQACVDAVTNDRDEDGSIPGAYNWPTAKVMVELVFAWSDVGAVMPLVRALENNTDSFIAVTARHTYVSYHRLTDDTAKVDASIVRKDLSDDLELSDTPKRRVHTRDLVACSQAPLRGLLLSRAQLQSRQAKDIVDVVDTDAIPITELRTLVAKSVQFARSS